MSGPTQRVGVVVFGEVDGYDYRDAESGLMLATRQLVCAGDRQMGLPVTIPGRGASGEFKAKIADVIGLSWAASDGYLQLTFRG